MGSQSTSKSAGAILLASTVFLSLTSAAAPAGAQGPPGAFVSPVQAYTGPGTGTIMTELGPGPFGAAYLLSVPANNYKGPATGYAGMNFPPIGAGLAEFSIDPNQIGRWDSWEIRYFSSVSADPGLIEVVQERNGHYHTQIASVHSVPTGSETYSFTSTPADMSPAFIGGSHPQINKAALMFYGGKAASSNSIVVFGSVFTGDSGLFLGFDCFGEPGFASFCPEGSADSAFNFEFNYGNSG